MLEAARLNLCTQQVIHTGLPTGASGFEAGQHIAIKPNGGGDFGIQLHRSHRPPTLTRLDSCRRVNAGKLTRLGLGQRSAQVRQGLASIGLYGLRQFFEVFIAPLRLRRGQGAMQGNPCYARLFADLPYTPQGAFSCPFGTIHLVPPNPMKA